MSNELQNINGWAQYQKLVLKELEHHTQELKELRQELHNLNVQTAQLKIQAGIWGALAGAVPAAILLALRFIGS